MKRLTIYETALAKYETRKPPTRSTKTPLRASRKNTTTLAGRGRPALPTGILPVTAYVLALDMPEPEIVAHLFKLYADKVKSLNNPA